MKLKNFFTKVLLIIIFGFVLVFSFFLFYNIFRPSSAFLVDSLSAFFGAFFAFFFIRLADAFSRLYERHVKHYNALVKLEQILNKYFVIIETDLMTVDDFEINLKETIRNQKISINPRSIKTFPIHDEILLELFGQHILQELLTYNLDLYILNGDLETTNRYYENIVERCLDEKDIDTYTYNLKKIVEGTGILKKFLISLKDKSITLLSEVRVLMEEKPVYTKIMFKLLPTKKPRNYDKKVNVEKEKIKQEIEKMMKENNEEIEKTLFG